MIPRSVTAHPIAFAGRSRIATVSTFGVALPHRRSQHEARFVRLAVKARPLEPEQGHDDGHRQRDARDDPEGSDRPPGAGGDQRREGGGHGATS